MNRAARRARSEIFFNIAHVIGEEKALALVWAFRGQALYVPKDPATKPGIAEAIGETSAAAFCGAFWRTYVYMPISDALELKVLDALDRGEKPPVIATDLGISERRVYRIKQRNRADMHESDDQQRLL